MNGPEFLLNSIQPVPVRFEDPLAQVKLATPGIDVGDTAPVTGEVAIVLGKVG